MTSPVSRSTISGPFSRPRGGPRRPLSFDKLVRAYQSPVLDANLKHDVSWL